ncbi:MAG TPA: hypothetical protein VNX26_07830 [Candidatus Acidoferrum sp.]|jgi:hypothetical protein|nr:hypothetical protein [Candidatus Acidoferrum sp.]
MKYQLVLQFEASKTDDYDQLVLLEDECIERLQIVAIVDGHDFGAGEFNIFLRTDDPCAAFREAQGVVTNRGLQNVMRAAYRELAAEDYVILWPPSLTEFTVV